MSKLNNDTRGGSMRIFILVCFLALLGLTCPVAAQTVITSGTMSYTVGRNTPTQWVKTLRWNFSNVISYSAGVTLAPSVTTEPFFARGGSNIESSIINFTAPDGQRGTVVDEGTTFQNYPFGNINNPLTTTLTIDVGAHGIRKFNQDLTGVNIEVPFTMSGRISLFLFYSPFENNPQHTRQVVGSGIANIRYNRVDNTHQVLAFDAMPNPKVVLSSILFTFAPPARPEPVS